MDNEALYNKHRPAEFSEVCGQESIIPIITEQIKTNTLPHSLVFYGPPGVGKTTVSRLIAKAYNPAKVGLKEIDAANNDGKVEGIRTLLPTLQYQPLDGDHLTVVFDEAHKLTEGAFQALQKVVEEPPENVRFIFATTRVDKIPNTILDRSQRHQFTRINAKTIFNRVKQISVEEYNDEISDELLSYVVHVGNGSLRRAIVALGQVKSLTNSNISGIDIAESLGILGAPKLGNFLYKYLSYVPKNGLSSMLEAGKMFESEKVDPIRGLADFQQYIIDVWSFLEDEQCESFLYYDISPLINQIKQNIAVEGIDFNNLKPLLTTKLDQIYTLSLEAENMLQQTSNQSAAIRRFIIKLVSGN